MSWAAYGLVWSCFWLAIFWAGMAMSCAGRIFCAGYGLVWVPVG
jgi:hypothetical protein